MRSMVEGVTRSDPMTGGSTLAAEAPAILASRDSAASRSGRRALEGAACGWDSRDGAVDYLVTLGAVDEERVGVLGVCGGGGYAVNAAMAERRLKAVATVVGANYGRLVRRRPLSADAAIKAMEAVSKQRTAEARGAETAVTTYIPRSKAELEAAGVKDVDVVQAVDSYTTPRGRQPGSPNRLNVVSTGAAFNWDAFHLADLLLTQPLQIIIGGGQPGLFGSYRDGFELFDKARSAKKDLFIVPGATHDDLYDKPDCVDQAVGELKSFYGENL